MSDIFDEVEEEVRKERWEQLWKKYGNYFVAGAVLVVLIVGGWRGWQYWEKQRNEEASTAFIAAQELAQKGNLVAAEAAFAKLAEDSPAGYATVSKMVQAAVLLTQSKREAALVILRDLMNSEDAVLANAARLQMAWVEADYAAKTRLQEILGPLLAADNPFRFSAQEVLAYSALRIGARAEALATFDRLGKDRTAPDGLRARCAAIAEYLRANPDIATLPAMSVAPTLPFSPRPAPEPAPAPGPANAGAPAPTTATAPTLPAPAAPAPEASPQ